MNKYSSKPTSAKHVKHMKLPSYGVEFCWVSVTLMFLKLYSMDAYQSLSFFTVCIPLMLYLVINLFGYLLKFIQMMHIEDEKDLLNDEGSFFGILTQS